MYCGENEFRECVEAIERQTYKDWEHFVVSNLPNKKAHDTLYRTFMERAEDFDLFLKIDADMVIENTDLLASIVEKFRTRANMLHCAIPVYDFFSDQLIPEMNVYRSSVTWRPQDDLFPDTSWIAPEWVVRDTELAPAAIHCKNPSDFQAFHYGLHKGVKVIQAGRKHRKESRARLHWSIISGIWRHLQRCPDRRLALAALGSELALSRTLALRHIDYENDATWSIFRSYSSWSLQELESEAKGRRWANWGWLPHSLRLTALSAPSSSIPDVPTVSKYLLRKGLVAGGRSVARIRERLIRVAKINRLFIQIRRP
ncbi:MAG: hypothetical protein R6U98_07725 [Pirellulaceae bacterium]